MDIYINDLQSVPITPQWPWGQGCKLFSLNRHKLHDFAHTIGLHPTWFHNDPHFPHYNLSPGKRIAAVMHGAIQTTDYETDLFKRFGVIDEEPDDGN